MLPVPALAHQVTPAWRIVLKTYLGQVILTVLWALLAKSVTIVHVHNSTRRQENEEQHMTCWHHCSGGLCMSLLHGIVTKWCGLAENTKFRTTLGQHGAQDITGGYWKRAGCILLSRHGETVGSAPMPRGGRGARLRVAPILPAPPAIHQCVGDGLC